MLKSLRMVVLMGAMRSTRPVTTDVPEEVRSSTLSPTTKGRVTNCNTYQVLRYNCHTLHRASNGKCYARTCSVHANNVSSTDASVVHASLGFKRCSGQSAGLRDCTLDICDDLGAGVLSRSSHLHTYVHCSITSVDIAK